MDRLRVSLDAVPSGKHQGRSLESLSDKDVSGLWLSWSRNDALRASEFFGLLESEHNFRVSRQTSWKEKNAEARRQKIVREEVFSLQQKQERRLLTLEEFNAARSPKGGHSRATLASWGVPWPPPKGWKKQLLRHGIPYNPNLKAIPGKLPFAKPLTGMVDAKCSACGRASRIHATSWEGEGVASKPKCSSCGHLVYLADPSLVVVSQGRSVATFKF